MLSRMVFPLMRLSLQKYPLCVIFYFLIKGWKALHWETDKATELACWDAVFALSKRNLTRSSQHLTECVYSVNRFLSGLFRTISPGPTVIAGWLPAFNAHYPSVPAWKLSVCMVFPVLSFLLQTPASFLKTFSSELIGLIDSGIIENRQNTIPFPIQ